MKITNNNNNNVIKVINVPSPEVSLEYSNWTSGKSSNNDLATVLSW